MQNKIIIIAVMLQLILPFRVFSQPTVVDSTLDRKSEYYRSGKPKQEMVTNPITGEVVIKKYFRDGQLKNSATYVNDVLSGDFIEYHENGQPAIKMSYIQGKENGLFQKFYSNGQLAEEGMYYLGNGEGPFKKYFENGQLAEDISYKGGRAQGPYASFFMNGRLQKETVYRDGLPEGSYKTYFENGQVHEIFNFKHGVREGEFKVFDLDGNLEMAGVFQDDALNGTVVTYYKSGLVKSAMDFKSGKIDGYLRDYDLKGLLDTVGIYKKGAIVSQKDYDDKGDVIKEKMFLNGRLPLPPLNEVHLAVGALGFLFGLMIAGRVLSRHYKSRMTVERAHLRVLDEEDIAQSRKDKEANLLHEESGQLYRRLVETVNSGLFFADVRGTINYVNFSFAQIWGYTSKTDMVGQNIKSFLVDPDYKFWPLLYDKNLVKDYVIHCQTPQGKPIVIAVSANLLFDDQGGVSGIEGVVDDISDKFALQSAVHLEKRKLELILEFYEKIDNVRDINTLAEFVVEGVSDILESERCSLMLEEPQTDTLTVLAAVGLPDDVRCSAKVKIGESICGWSAQRFEPLLVKNIEYDERFARAKLPYYLGRSFMVVPFRVGDQLTGVINVADKKPYLNAEEPFNDIDFKILRIIAGRAATALENVRLFTELNLQTVTDPITQIYNYRLFSETLDQEIRRLKRTNTDLCVSMIDMDHFKSYNDAFGHVEGDNLLRTFGEILKTNLRDTDIVCRYAGDEFCVVFPNTGLDGAWQAAEKVRKVVERYPFKKPVTLSIGIAQYEPGMAKKDFIAKADAALYEAKEGGRNRVVLAPKPPQA